MTKPDLWKVYVKKNPSFNEGPISFTAAGLRKFFDQTWEQGYLEGAKDDYDYKVSPHHTSGASKPIDAPDFLTDLFNTSRKGWHGN